MPRCAILLHGEDGVQSSNANYIKARAIAYNILTGLGYEVDMLNLAGTDTAILNESGSKYAFYVIPQSDTSVVAPTATTWAQIGKVGTAFIPTFVSNFNQNSDRLGSINRVSNSPASVKLQYKTASNPDLYLSIRRFDPDPGETVEPLLTTSSGQVTDGKMAAWKWQGPNAVYYVDCCGVGYTALPLLLHEAIANGDIPAAPRKKQYVLDCDDCPTTVNTAAEIVRFRDFLQARGLVIHVGINGDFGNGDSNREAQDNIILNAQDTFYCQEHQIGSDDNFFNWDLTDAGGDMDAEATVYGKKLIADTRFRATMSAFWSRGVRNRGLNNGGYKYFNQNAVSIEGCHLMTPETHVAADPNGATAIAGYGMDWIRITRQSPLALGHNGTHQEDVQFLGIKTTGYMLLVGTGDKLKITDSQADIDTRLVRSVNMATWAFQVRFPSFASHATEFETGAGDNGALVWENNVDLLLALNNVYEYHKTPYSFVWPA